MIKKLLSKNCKITCAVCMDLNLCLSGPVWLTEKNVVNKKKIRRKRFVFTDIHYIPRNYSRNSSRSQSTRRRIRVVPLQLQLGNPGSSAFEEQLSLATITSSVAWPDGATLSSRI